MKSAFLNSLVILCLFAETVVAGDPMVLHDSTPVKLRLNRDLTSASARAGETVDFEVVDDVKVDDIAVIKCGAIAVGSVTEAKPKGKLGKAGKLNVTIDYVRLVNDEKVALRGMKQAEGAGNSGKMTIAIAASSIVFFPVAPLFLFMKGKDITIPKGHEITAYVNGEITLERSEFKKESLSW